MTDDELEARLRRLDVRSEKDEAFWDGMAAAVRDGVADEERRAARRATTRRRRLTVSGMSLLAMAAALALWLRGHHQPLPAHEPIGSGETFHVFEDLEPGELLEELSPADVERVAAAFNKGA
jgi:ferric-dicitrate binding protein FerR (iron transport regulator)